MASMPWAARRATLSRICWRISGGWPTQPMSSSTTTTGSVVRYDFVGLPGNFLSVRLGSSSYGPVGSTT